MSNSTAELTGNITASGHSLREVIEEDTGYDPITEPAYAWSNELPCDDCEVHDSTARVILADDGETATRLCYHCYAAATGRDA